jgi:hypothetical protein
MAGTTFFIDVSAKLENWTADSVIAMTNSDAVAYIISARIKQEARAWLRERFPRRKGAYHAYVLLSILIAIVTAPVLERIEHIVIDRDYSGQGTEGKIKNELIPLLQRRRTTFSGRQILFQAIKGTKADRLARQVYQKTDRDDWRHITLAEIKEVLEKQ